VIQGILPPSSPPPPRAQVIYDGDPLRDHTLAAFLDKFLQKKPKAHAKGSSLMQPLAGGRDGTNAQTLGAISGAAFAALAETQVRVKKAGRGCPTGIACHDVYLGRYRFAILRSSHV
jgi:hypothetical protein